MKLLTFEILNSFEEDPDWYLECETATARRYHCISIGLNCFIWHSGDTLEYLELSGLTQTYLGLDLHTMKADRILESYSKFLPKYVQDLFREAK